MIEMLIYLVLCHLIGDYLFQTDFITKTKGSNWYHLFIHCVLYCVPFIINLGINWQLGVIFIVHAVVDALKARYKTINYWQDQLCHYACLILYFI